jgi:hypothetical protein
VFVVNRETPPTGGIDIGGILRTMREAPDPEMQRSKMPG